MKSSLSLLILLSLLAAAKHSEAQVHSSTSSAEVEVKTSASPPIAGSTSGGGPFTIGSSVTVQATPKNDCYEFVEWKVGTTKSTENPFTFTATKNETAVAIFAQLEYTISTGSSPAKAGTTSGGGKKGCGTTTTIMAHANPGFAFVDWTESGDTNVISTSPTCKIPVSGSESFVASFKDIKPPVVTVISPVKNQAVPSAAFPIQGTASDNVGLAAVYYNLNGAGWILATTTDGFSNWYAWVTLAPDGPNTVSAYAVDTSGNKSTNGPVKFTCSAAGLAPLSIANHEAGVTEGTNAENSMLVSFDSAMYATVSADTNNGGGVGTYTFTPTGPNTAELVQKRVFPTEPPAAGTSVAELTFTDAYTAGYTNNAGSNGVYGFVLTGNIVPASLDGSSIVSTSFENSNAISTNTFGMATFTNEDSFGNSSSGPYTFTKFTEVAALIVETVAYPPSSVGTTNYIVLTFSTATAPITGFYDYSSESAGRKDSLDSGSFVVTLGTDTTRFLGPVSLSGLQAVITPTGAPSFTRTYGNGTFASISLKSIDEPTDVGIALANTRVSANTGFDQYMAVAPPYAVGLDEGTSVLTFTSASMANLSATGSSIESAKVAYSKLLPNAPAALTGHTIVVTPMGKGQTKSTLTFTNNTVTVSGNTGGNGTYTYSPYTPTMALVQFSFGSSDYLLLEFTSTAGGFYVYAQPDAAGWKYTEGNFAFSTTK